MAFGIPMIHVILNWKNGPEERTDGNAEAAAEVESLYLPSVDESTESANMAESATEGDQEDSVELSGEENEGEEDQIEGDSDEDQHDVEEEEEEAADEDEQVGRVQIMKTFNQQPTDGQSPLLGLVLTPTRELAVQVKHHIDAVAKFTGKSLFI